MFNLKSIDRFEVRAKNRYPVMVAIDKDGKEDEYAIVGDMDMANFFAQKYNETPESERPVNDVKDSMRSVDYKTIGELVEDGYKN